MMTLLWSLLTTAITIPIIDGKMRDPIVWSDISHVFQEEDHIPVNIGDQMDFICPVKSQHTNARAEYYIIYQATADEYNDCHIYNINSRRKRSTNIETKMILNCSKPYDEDPQHFRFQFNRISPIGAGFDFLPGRDYYFLTTSSGDIDGINMLKDGACLYKNMKITIRVSDRPTTPRSTLQPAPSPTTSRTTRRISSTTSQTTTTSRTTSSTRRSTSSTTSRTSTTVSTTQLPSSTTEESGVSQGVVNDGSPASLCMSWTCLLSLLCLHLLISLS